MNFHTDKWIMQKLEDHYKEALEYFPEERIVGVFLQGSQNYGLDYEDSDIDTKLILTPSLKDICLNKQPISTTYVRLNLEHTDWKDVRLYIETFRKQNLNFLEILFTDYYIINPLYKKEWMRLVEKREEIARMNEFRAVKSMKGIAMEKYHAMEKPYPSKLGIIAEYGYDGKQVSHLIRVNDYLKRYIAGEKYKNCLLPSPEKCQKIIDYKMLNVFSLAEAREEAKRILDDTIKIADEFCQNKKDIENSTIRKLLEDVGYNIIKISIEIEIELGRNSSITL
jgi:predicted nucleotidyltransferase